jgi:cyclopropane fatty-acyl-phospholipid synthase-like methyltransferase
MMIHATARANSPASERNKRPILEVLRTEFREVRHVLEIGSGTGQHAVFFAREMPHLRWQTSDLAENHESIRARLATHAPRNVEPPLLLDVDDVEALVPDGIDAVFSSNTAHIMSVRAVHRMFALVGRSLAAGGKFCLYGPFNFDGEFSSESNARFDASLRQRKATMGIRDLGDLDEYASESGMSRTRLYAMPAMNYIAVWEKAGAAPQTG